MKNKHKILGPKMRKKLEKEKNEIYIINQVKPGCFKAQKVIDEANGPQHEAPQPDEEPPRGIWFKINIEFEYAHTDFSLKKGR